MNNTFLLPWDLREARPLQLVKRSAGTLSFSNGNASGWVFCATGLLFLVLLPLIRPDARFAALWVLGIPGALFFLLGPIAAWGTKQLRIDLDKGTYASLDLQLVTWKKGTGPLTDITSICVGMRLFYLYHRWLPFWIAELRFRDKSISITTDLPTTRYILSGLHGTSAAGLARKEKMADLVRSLAAVSHAPLHFRSGGREHRLDSQALTADARSSARSPQDFPALPAGSGISVTHDEFLGNNVLGTKIFLPRRQSASSVASRLKGWAIVLLGGGALLPLSLLLDHPLQYPAMLIAAVLLGAGVLGLVLTVIFINGDEYVRSDSSGIFVYQQYGDAILRFMSFRSARITSIAVIPSEGGTGRLSIRAHVLRTSIGCGLTGDELEWLRQAVLFMSGQDAQEGSPVLQ